MQVVSLQRQLNASADETLRYTRAAEDRRNEVSELSNSLQDEAARADDAAQKGEELRSAINARCVMGWCGGWQQQLGLVRKLQRHTTTTGATFRTPSSTVSSLILAVA